MFVIQFYEVACARTQIVFYTFKNLLQNIVHERKTSNKYWATNREVSGENLNTYRKKQYINTWLSRIKHNSLLKLRQSFKDRTILQIKIVN